MLDPGGNSRVIWEQSELSGVIPLQFQKNFAALVHSVLCATSAEHVCVVCGAGACRASCKGHEIPAVPRGWEFSAKGCGI